MMELLGHSIGTLKHFRHAARTKLNKIEAGIIKVNFFPFYPASPKMLFNY